jgi:hypothetical protein
MKAITKGSIRDEKGAALLLAVILLLVGGLISAALLGHMGTGILAGEVYDTKTAELYAADAGVEDALLKIQNQVEEVAALHCPGNHTLPYTIADVNGKGVSVSITLVRNETSDRIYSITSIATTPDSNSQTTVESYVKYTPAIPPVEPVFLFDNAIRSDTTLSSTLGTWVTSYQPALAGNIVTGGKFTVSGNIYGNVTVPTAGNLSTQNGIHGTVTYAEYSPPAAANISLYKTQAMAAENATFVVPASNYNNGGTITGSARLTGNLALASGKTLTVNGDLYIEGYVALAKDSTLTLNGALYVGSHVDANADLKLPSTLNFGGTSYVYGYMTLGENNISEVSYVIIAEGTIKFGALDNGNKALIDDITLKKVHNGVLSGLNSTETAFLDTTDPHSIHSIIMSEAGNITTGDITDWDDLQHVAIAGFLYAPDGLIATDHFFELIGAMYGKSVQIRDLRQIYAGTPVGSSGSGSDGSPASLTILTWDIH